MTTELALVCQLTEYLGFQFDVVNMRLVPLLLAWTLPHGSPPLDLDAGILLLVVLTDSIWPGGGAHILQKNVFVSK